MRKGESFGRNLPGLSGRGGCFSAAILRIFRGMLGGELRGDERFFKNFHAHDLI